MTYQDSLEIKKYLGKVTLNTIEKRISSGKIDINFINSKRHSLLKFAIWNKSENFAKLLIKNGAKFNPDSLDESSDLIVIQSATHNCLEVVKYCVSLGHDVNARVDILDPPLVSAARYGHIKICKYLLENGADVNIQDGFSSGVLSIMASKRPSHESMDNYQEIIKLLFEYGVDKHVADYDQKTPLTWAIERDNFKLIEFFCANATELDVSDYRDEIYDSIAATSTGKYTIELLDNLSLNYKLSRSLSEKPNSSKIKI